VSTSPDHQTQEADRGRTAGAEAAPSASWDFSKIPVFAPDRPSGPEARSPLLQPKLIIGEVNDPLEHEADRVADQVMRMTGPEVSAAAAPPQVSRKCTACEEEKLQKKEAGPQAATGEAPGIVHEVLRSPGQPLDATTLAYFGPRFGRDFSSVRVHTGAAAGQSARDVNAHAYTVGRNMVFDAGRFAPGTHDGQRLIAHELTHVVQQSGSDGIRVDRTAEKRGPLPISQRCAQTLSREPATVVDAPPPVHAAEGATPENRQLAEIIDALDLEELKPTELAERRSKALKGATGRVGDEQQLQLLTLEAIEFLARRRDPADRRPAGDLSRYELDTLEPDWNERKRSNPTTRRLNVRALIEGGVQLTGSFKEALGRFTHTREIETDVEFFEAEADRFATEFKGQARLTADRMLEGSLGAIHKILNSYGLPFASTISAAERLARGSDVDTEAEHVVQVAKRGEDIDEPASAKHRTRLAEWVKALKKHQQTVNELFIRSHSGDIKRPATWDAARKAEAERMVARNALKAAWIDAERLHPILAAYRRGDDLEKIDLGTLDRDPVDQRMKAVLVHLLPTIVNIGKARWLVKNKKNFALTLPSVIALTRANMFIPEGSIRAGIVKDLAAEAATDADSVLIQVLAFALAAITLIPSGGASLAIPAGVALAAYSAAQEWEKYDTQKTLVGTDIDLARSLSTDEPSLTGFALSLVSLGFEGLPLISAFNKARKIKALVHGGEDFTAAVAELNTIGKSHGGADDLGKRALADAEAAEKRTATHVAEEEAQFAKAQPRAEARKPLPETQKAPGLKPETFAETNHIPLKDLKAEITELRKDASDVAKVHRPADPHSQYDAEMKASDGHTLRRDKDTHLWERCSGPPCKKDLKLDQEVDRAVDKTLEKSAGLSAAPMGASGATVKGYRIIGDEAEYLASQRGYHVYEYRNAKGQVLYTGKSGSIQQKGRSGRSAARIEPVPVGTAEPPFNNWVDRLRDDHSNTFWIRDATEVRVIHDLSEAEMWALEEVRIEQTSRTNWNKEPGKFSSQFRGEGLNREVLAKSAEQHPTAVFSIRRVTPAKPR